MRLTACVSCMAILVAVAASAVAQPYPYKPLRFVVPFPPGGGADNLARIVGQKVSADFGQPLVVDNRAGAGGNIAAEVAAQAAPDGYTLLQANVAHTIAVSLYPKLNYDLLKDFEPVTQLASVPFVLLVNPSVGARSVSELIALAKRAPTGFDYASSGVGGPSHMAMELFRSVAGLEMRHIPYKGAAPAATDLIAGRVQLMFFTVSAALPHITSGKLRALGIASGERFVQLPQIPTISEAGLPGFEATTWFGVMVPSGTPAPIVKKLHAVFGNAVRTPAIRDRLVAQGFAVVGSTPQEFGAFVKKEIPKWARVVKASGASAR